MLSKSRLSAKITCVFLCLLLVASVLAPASFAVDEKDKAEPVTAKYPCVFVAGIFGWGEDDEEFYEKTPYWGMKGENLINLFRESGTECCAASVGPISSAWDRACDLYAQLTGTVTDYGEAHSAACGHSRYGQSYEGKALLKNFGDTKINLFGHSFGGVTVRLFTYLLENGAPEEIEATGRNTSPLFTGGRGNLIHSVTTLAAPHNGCVLADYVHNLRFPVVMGAATVNAFSSVGYNPLFAFKLEQFGLTVDPDSGEKAPFNLPGAVSFEKYSDNCSYDLSLEGAKAINERIDKVDGVYYFSYACNGTRDSKIGSNQMPTKLVGTASYLSAFLIGRCSGRTVGGIELTDEWEPNDGLVSVKSALYPFDEPHTDFTSVSECKSGVWYVMPVIEGGHGTYVGGSDFDVESFYYGQFAMLNALK